MGTSKKGDVPWFPSPNPTKTHPSIWETNPDVLPLGGVLLPSSAHLSESLQSQEENARLNTLREKNIARRHAARCLGRSRSAFPGTLCYMKPVPVLSDPSLKQRTAGRCPLMVEPIDYVGASVLGGEVSMLIISLQASSFNGRLAILE